MPGTVMSFVTTEPAPTTTLSQIVTGRMVALVPIETLLPMVVGFHRSFRPQAGPPIWNTSLMNMAPCEMKQSSPMVTSSQIKAWDWIRARLPMVTCF